MSIENMTETYEIIEARGSNNQIKIVTVLCTYEHENVNVSHIRKLDFFDEQVDSTIAEDELLEKCKLKIDLNDLREISYSQLLSKQNAQENSEIYIQRNDDIVTKFNLDTVERFMIDSVPRLYARLALIKNGLWDQVKLYFEQPERTEKEKAFFEDAIVWRKNDPIIRNVLDVFQLTEQDLDNLFLEANKLEAGIEE